VIRNTYLYFPPGTIHLDTFGNCVTTIPVSRAAGQEDPASHNITVEIQTEDGPIRVEGLSTSYDGVREGEIVALAGSNDLLEVAINGGHLARELGLESGASVRLVDG
jgi:S-adenosylmethionine hydrolase